MLWFTIAIGALHAAVDVPSQIATLAVVIIVSLLLGAVCGFAASRIAALMDDHVVELTLTGVLAYGTYLLADSLGQSGIIATMTAGIVLGSYGRRVGISPGSVQAVDTVWEFVAFVLTAVVLLLIGLTISFADLASAAGPIAWGIVAIVLGRVVVVYGLLSGVRGVEPYSADAHALVACRVLVGGPRGRRLCPGVRASARHPGSGPAAADDLRRRAVHAACPGGVGRRVVLWAGLEPDRSRRREPSGPDPA